MPANDKAELYEVTWTGDTHSDPLKFYFSVDDVTELFSAISDKVGNSKVLEMTIVNCLKPGKAGFIDLS